METTMQFAVRVADLLAGRAFALDAAVIANANPLGSGVLARCAGVLVGVTEEDNRVTDVRVSWGDGASPDHAEAAIAGARAALRVTLGRPIAPAPTGDGGLWLSCVNAARRSVEATLALASEELGLLEARILAGDESAREAHEEARAWYAHLVRARSPGCYAPRPGSGW